MENVPSEGFQSLLFEASAVGFVGEGLEVERRAVVRCGQTDLAMKSTGQDAQELLTGLLLELAAPSRPAGRQGARG